MPCYHLGVALCKKHGIVRKDGNPGTKISRIIFAHEPEFMGYEYYIKENERFEKSNDPYLKDCEYKFIPCQKCIGCRSDQRQEWALRVELEQKQYKNNYFLTLTYNDEHLPMHNEVVNEDTGEIFYNPGIWKGTLQKKDAITFIKSLRKYFEREYNWEGMKFYICGEYGDIGKRPHYHAIIMNCPKLDEVVVGINNKTKMAYKTNERIEKIWGKGFVNIGQVNWDSISYVTGYCTKKLFGPVGKEIYAIQGQDPIFANMSRRPGIGNAYFQENKEKIYRNDEIINSKGKPVKPPSYFDRLMDIGEHDVMEAIKDTRKKYSMDELKKKMSKTTITIKEQMQIDEQTAIDQSNKYKARRKAYNQNIT